MDIERSARMTTFTYERKLSFPRELSVPSKMERFNQINIENSVDVVVVSTEKKQLYNSTYIWYLQLKPEDREHVQIFEKIMNLLTTYAKFVGVDLIYQWVPVKSIALWFAIFNIWYTWASVLNTQRMHLNNGEVLRALEPCALYGIASSVV